MKDRKEGGREGAGLAAEGAVGTERASGKVRDKMHLVCCFKPRARVRFV